MSANPFSETKVFVNFAVSNVQTSSAFYQALGFTQNPMFSDDNAHCIVVNDSIFFMILDRARFADFSTKRLIDPATEIQTLIALNLESREVVDQIATKGLAAGGSEPRAVSDLGFMYTRTVADPDGNTLELFFMDPAAVEQGPTQ